VNSLGQKVLRVRTGKIDVSLLPQGLYFLILNLENETVVRKLILN
jgi:hypothetical protein